MFIFQLLKKSDGRDPEPRYFFVYPTSPYTKCKSINLQIANVKKFDFL